MDKLSLFKSLKKEKNLKSFALKSGYHCIDKLDKIEFFELFDRIILYTENSEFFIWIVIVVNVLMKVK